MVAWSSELHSLHAIGSGPLWQPVTHCSHVMQARVVLELRVGEQQGLLSLLVWQQRLPCVVFPVGDILRQVLVPALRKQEDANDADERAAGEDDMVQEVAFLVVQLNNGRCQHAKTCTGQHQPEPTTPYHCGSDLCTEEDTEAPHRMGCKHSHDGKRNGELVLDAVTHP